MKKILDNNQKELTQTELSSETENTDDSTSCKKNKDLLPILIASVASIMLAALILFSLPSEMNPVSTSANTSDEQLHTSYKDSFVSESPSKTESGSVQETKNPELSEQLSESQSEQQESQSLQSSHSYSSLSSEIQEQRSVYEESSYTYVEHSRNEQSQKSPQNSVHSSEKNSLIHYYPSKFAETDRYGFSAVDITAGKCSARKLLLPDNFINAEFSSVNYGRNNRLSCDVSAKCHSSAIIVLQFAAYTSSGSSKLDVNIGGNENRVSISEEPYYFYICTSGLDYIDNVSFTSHSDNDVHISDAALLDYGYLYGTLDITTGCFQIKNYNRTTLDADSAIAMKAKSAVICGNYLYAVSGTPESCLSVYKLNSNGSTRFITQMNGLGDARDIKYNKNKNALIVTARRRGAYIIDISSPENPVLCSEYDTTEYACGLCTEGNYTFICSRWFGVEIVDISNVNDPKYVCTLSGDAEYEGCFVYNNILYASAYHEKRIDVWDIHYIDSPVLLDQIYLDGAGQGLFTDGNYLYAATALNSSNDTSSVKNYGKGTGNGLEIFDVSDPHNIRWVSTTKFDGRFNINFQDVWDVQVSGGLAYVSCICYGTVIVDVSNVNRPVIKKELLIRADITSEKYIDYGADNRVYVWSFDNSKESFGAVFHTLLSNGRLYMISSNMGIYSYKSDDIRPAVYNGNSKFSYLNKGYSLPYDRNYKFEHFDCGYQIWAAAKLNDLYALACGNGGIIILDKNLKKITELKTKSPVRDIKVSGDIIYTAECSSGLGIYQWKNGRINNISHCITDKSDICFGSIQITNDNCFAVVEASMVSHCVINISDIYHPFEEEEYRLPKLGSTYFRTICNGLVNNKFIGIGGEKNITWFFSENGVLNQVLPQKNIVYFRSNGMTAYGNDCIAIYDGGYVLLDPETNRISSVKSVSGVKLEGKPSVWGNTLIVSREYSDLLTFVDISNLNSPELITEIHINGNPDICLADGNSLLVPCRYGGLLRITKK